MSVTTTVITVTLVLAALPVLAAAGYLAWLAALSREPVAPPSVAPATRFDVVVPAHDEEAGIERTVRSLLALDYPRDRFRVVVIADNCTDRTAALARAAGAIVVERRDLARRGKGHALAHAFAFSRESAVADAVVVVDADTIAASNLLSAFAARLAQGEETLQAEYAVANPDESWRTRLMAIAFALFHGVRSRTRERFALSCGLRGNGMCFTHAVLARVPYDAFSVVEDVEFGIAVARAGVRVAYVEETRVASEMPAGGRAAGSQRARWEGGRAALARADGLPLLRDAVARRSAMLADLAMDLLVPPLGKLAATTVLGALAAGALVASHVAAPVALAPWAAALVALGAYVARGCALSGTGARGAATLVAAPIYVAWKVGVALRRRATGTPEWVRTERRDNIPETV